MYELAIPNLTLLVPLAYWVGVASSAMLSDAPCIRPCATKGCLTRAPAYCMHELQCAMTDGTAGDAQVLWRIDLG